MSVIERRRFAAYGLPARGFLGKHFWSGALWGFVMLSFIVALMAASHSYSVDGLALSAAELVKYGLLWALGIPAGRPVRGILLSRIPAIHADLGHGLLAGRRNHLSGVCGSTLRNPGENWVGVLEIVLIALFLCLALRRTGNLWFAIGWHMSFDWGESFFYSTPNSGIQATGHMLKVSMNGVQVVERRQRGTGGKRLRP